MFLSLHANNTVVITCSQVWTHKFETSPEKDTTKTNEKVFIVQHNCTMVSKSETICVHETGKMDILETTSGTLLRSMRLKDASIFAKPSLLCTQHNSHSTCYISYFGKNEEDNDGSFQSCLKFQSLSEKAVEFLLPMKSENNQENFSQILIFQELLFFGGRDDTLHVIQLRN